MKIINKVLVFLVLCTAFVPAVFAGGQTETANNGNTDPWRQFEGEELNIISTNITFAQELKNIIRI